jgi:hypothetical protein
MLARSLILAVLFSIACAAAQPAGPSVTVSASKQINLPIEQANFEVSVGSGLSATLDQVLPVVQSLGLTASDLASISGPSIGFQLTTQPPNQILWSFRLVRSFAQLSQAFSELNSWSNGVNSKFTATFALASLATTEATTRRLADDALPGLIADARAKAQHLADAAGLTVGPILSLTNPSIPAVVGVVAPGRPDGTILSLAQIVNLFAASPTSTASVTIRFSLIRFSNPY